MVSSKRISINILSSSGQVLITGVVYLFLYKLLLQNLTIELLGVWSVVLSTSSLANLANFGISTSVVRYVALYLNDNNKEKILDLVFTSSVFILFLFTLICCIVYPFSGFLLKNVIDRNYLNDALEILPYSILCLIVNAVAGVYAAVLDGLQRNYLRNVIFVISSLLLLTFSIIFIRSYGLLGVAFAQLIQAIFTLFACYVTVKVKLSDSQFKWRWNSMVFKEIFSYGMKFQVIAFSNMLNDPFTKILLVKFGGLQLTGFYEMANRLVIQLRSVIVSANQSLVPVIVGLNDKPNNAFFLYQKTFLLVFIFSIISFGSLSLSASLISTIWIGRIELVFISCLILLALGYFINILAGPAYFSYLADGKLRLLIISHIILSVCNSIFGFILGKYFGGIGVVVGVSCALIVSSIIIIKSYQNARVIVISQILTAKYFYMGLTVLLLILLQYLIRGHLPLDSDQFIYIDVSIILIFWLFTFLIILRDFKSKLLNF